MKYLDGRRLPSYLAERPLACEGYIVRNYVRSRFLFPSTMVLRRDSIERCGFFDEEMLICEDLELFACIGLHGKVAWSRRPLTVRYEGTHNLTSKSERIMHYAILAFNKILQKEPDMPRSVRRAIEKELGQHYRWRSYAALQQAKRGEASTDALGAIRLDATGLRAVLPTLIASLLPP